MYSQILINVEADETRVALLEDNQLVEFYLERGAASRLSGNIYKGKIEDVLPGMQAAFVNIGLNRNAFLFVGDITDRYISETNVKSLAPAPSILRKIEEIIKKGEHILIQVYKEPIEQKGARITTNIAISGKLLVYMPLAPHIGISHRIIDPKERERLRNIVMSIQEKEEGFIIRTQAINCKEEEILEEIYELRKKWQDILDKLGKIKKSGLVYQELPLSEIVVRDLLTEDINRVYVDDKEEYENICENVKNNKKHIRDRITLYEEQEPIFEKFNVENQITKALTRRINLKSGGYLIFDQTEALTSIDVNTGGFIGIDALENTAFEINQEAIQKIAIQIRLRNLGGMIIIDLIDMKEQEHRKRIKEEFENLLKRDRCKTQIVKLSELGLIELTRKRVGKSLTHLLMDYCPFCSGGGRIYSSITMCNQVKRMLGKEIGYGNKKLVVQTNQYYTPLLKKDETLLEFIEETAIEVEFQAIMDVPFNFLKVLPQTDYRNSSIGSA
ncbi:MAG: Rne/Rng family ribonuclease [Candidatus Hydrogenedentota bacterium]